MLTHSRRLYDVLVIDEPDYGDYDVSTFDATGSNGSEEASSAGVSVSDVFEYRALFNSLLHSDPPASDTTLEDPFSAEFFSESDQLSLNASEPELSGTLPAASGTCPTSMKWSWHHS